MSIDQMGSVLVTGATGIVGWSIVTALREQGHEVRALARQPDAAQAVLPAGVEVVTGDLADAGSLASAVNGCDTVFHAAGMPEQWLRDPRLFHRVNVEGTRALVERALAARVMSFVYTSTIDVFAARPGVAYDESVLADAPLATPYERSKQLADQVVSDAVTRGLPARFIHPAAVFGPSPSSTPGLNDIIAKLARNALPVLPPGGVPLVFAPDIARGQLAAFTAEIGSRYILCDRYVPFGELAELISRLTGSHHPPQLPPRLARIVARLTETASRLTHRAPLLPAGQLHFMTSRHQPDPTRAQAELGWTPTPLADAVQITITGQRPTSTSPHGRTR